MDLVLQYGFISVKRLIGNPLLHNVISRTHWLHHLLETDAVELKLSRLNGNGIGWTEVILRSDEHMKGAVYPVTRMELSKFDASQVKGAFNILRTCGIEPTAPTMKALVETAEAHYPDDPASLEKAARSLATFFAGSAKPPIQKSSWHWLRTWAFSLLRL